MNATRIETARQLIHRARSAGGSLAIHGDKLKALSVPADLLPELRAFKPEIVQSLTPAAEGVGTTDTMPAPKPITRPVLRFKLREGGGTVLGQPDDTPASLLADLIERWPDELVAAWSGTDQVYPLES